MHCNKQVHNSEKIYIFKDHKILQMYYDYLK